MKSFQRIIVTLDNTVFDEKIIRYFNRFCELIIPQKVQFLYVDPDLEVPPGINISYEDAAGNPMSKDEILIKSLKKKIDAGFTNRHGAEVSIDVLEGDPLKEILHWVKVKEADLLVAGNKKLSEGSGVFAKRVARHANCDILFVPETGQENIHRVLVPVDFSDHSKAATKAAIALASSLKGVSLTCFNTFDVPLTGGVGISMSYERFVEDVRAYKKEALEKYIREFAWDGIAVDTAVSVNERGNPAKEIYSFAVKGSYDLITIGAKGHSTMERVLMGSVTEKLLGLDKEIPVLVHRL